MEAHVETDQEYIKRITKIDMDYIHSTLQECLKGNVNKHMIYESLELVQKYQKENNVKP